MFLNPLLNNMPKGFLPEVNANDSKAVAEAIIKHITCYITGFTQRTQFLEWQWADKLALEKVELNQLIKNKKDKLKIRLHKKANRLTSWQLRNLGKVHLDAIVPKVAEYFRVLKNLENIEKKILEQSSIIGGN